MPGKSLLQLCRRQLGAPKQAQAQHILHRLQQKMGAAAFEQALASVQQPDSQEQDAVMTLEQLRQVVVQNTTAVFTTHPDQKADWWHSLSRLQADLRAQGQGDFAAFVGLLQQLVEGADPKRLTPQVPPDFQPEWREILDNIQPKE